MSAPAGPADAARSGLRVVVTGKGGVGKTTLVATLARLLARDDRRVLAGVRGLRAALLEPADARSPGIPAEVLG